VKVKAIEPGKLKSLGLEEGMVISKIDQQPVESVEQLTKELNTRKGGILLEVVLEGGKKEYLGFGL
jgi:hypothetical protein